MADDPQVVARQLSGAIQKARRPVRHSIPVLEDDPDVEEGISLYLDPNGNLRSIVDGVTYQYNKTATTTASGTFSSDPMPEMFEQTYSAAWARVFCAAHGVESPTFTGYGDDPANTHGYRKIMIGLPDATIRADTAGAVIDDVELSFTNVDAFASSVVLHIGWHDVTAAPTVWSATRAETELIEVPKVGPVWWPVDDVFGTALRDNIYKGLTIVQPAGLIHSGAIDWSATQIKITYTV